MGTFTINIEELLTPTDYFFEYTVPDNQVASFSYEGVDQGSPITPFTVDWGDGVIENFTSTQDKSVSHDYDGDFDGVIKTTTSKSFFDLIELSVINGSFNTTRLSQTPNLEIFIARASPITGNISNFPDSLREVFTRVGPSADENLLDGDLSGLPSNLEKLDIRGLNTISGNISNIPSTVSEFTLTGTATISGDISGLKEGLVNFDIYNNNNSFPSTLNNVSGNISNIPSTVSEFKVSNNTITGDISNFSNNIKTIELNDFDGNLNAGDHIYAREFKNTVFGDIGNLPNNITTISVAGDNTISGDISGLNLSNKLIKVIGNNTITGLIDNLDSTEDFTLIVGGLNTISGNIANIPNVPNPIILLQSSSEIDNNITYSNKNWSNQSSFRLELRGVSKMSTEDVDKLLIDLDNTLINKNRLKLFFIGSFRSSVSNTQHDNLVAAGANINIQLS